MQDKNENIIEKVTVNPLKNTIMIKCTYYHGENTILIFKLHFLELGLYEKLYPMRSYEYRKLFLLVSCLMKQGKKTLLA